MHHSSRAPRPLASPARMVTAAGPAGLHATIQGILQRIDMVDVFSYVASPSPPLPLESTVRQIATDTRALLDDLAAWYDAAAPSAPSAISDTATLGRMELSCHQAALAGAQGAPWQRVATCDGVLQVCRRCLRDLGRQLEETEGLPRAPDRTAEETATALEIRRAYIGLQRVVAGRGAPEPAELVSRLQASGDAIARVLECPAVRAMRADNLFMLQSFLTRVRASLLERPRAATAHDPLLRLWQDLDGFVSLLIDASRRDELRAHDLRAVEDALAQTERLASDAPPPPAVILRLRSCEGRDGELDLLLSAGCSTATLRGRLAHVRDMLAPPRLRLSQRCSGTWSGFL